MSSEIQAVRETLLKSVGLIECGDYKEAARLIENVHYYLSDCDTVFWVPVEYDGICVNPESLPEGDDYKLVSTRTKAGRTDWNRAYWDGKRWVGNIGTAEVYAWADIEPRAGELVDE